MNILRLSELSSSPSIPLNWYGIFVIISVYIIIATFTAIIFSVDKYQNTFYERVMRIRNYTVLKSITLIAFMVFMYYFIKGQMGV